MLDGLTYQPADLTLIPEIQQRIKHLMDLMLVQHCKVLFVRFDIRFTQGTVHRGKNEKISLLMKTLTASYFERGIASQYIWVREQINSDAPHYHVIMLLNGSKIQNPMGVWTLASDLWSEITNGSLGLLQQCWAQPVGKDFAGGVMIRRPSGAVEGEELLNQQQAFNTAYEAALGWGAYLAKEFSKDNTPRGVRRFGSSQL